MRTRSETKISDITVKKLETVGSSSSAQDAAIKMRDKQVSSVPRVSVEWLVLANTMVRWIEI